MSLCYQRIVLLWRASLHEVFDKSHVSTVTKTDIYYMSGQKCATEFCVKLGNSSKETSHMLQKAYGLAVMSRPAVSGWSKGSKGGKKRVVHNA
jgi:hypothetical protein